MTLGKKLSNRRKMLGWTQQQLGEYLNLSAQAVSKWENDLAEPDIITLKALANLYSVTLDELINNDNEDFAHRLQEDAGFHEEKARPRTVGYCKVCGSVVTEETVGARLPVIKCYSCVKAEKEKEIEFEENIETGRDKISAFLKRKMKRSFIVGGIFGVLASTLSIPFFLDSVSFLYVLISIGLALLFAYSAFSYVALLFYDGSFLRDKIEEWFCEIPPLIALIVQILFLIPFMIFSMFAFPFVIADVKKSIAKREKSKYVLLYPDDIPRSAIYTSGRNKKQ